MKRHVSIFLSSPGDVGLEREIAARVIRRLDGELSRRAQLEPYFWEHEPMRATADFQAQIPSPASFDVVICILWSRLGSRLHAQHKRPDGTSYASGTEYEFEEAAASFRARGTPELVVYRRRDVPSFPPEPEELLQERLRQWRSLQEFTKRWFLDPHEGTFQAAFNTYADAADFEAQLERHLRKVVLALLERDGPKGEAARATPPPALEGSPFRGLEAYGPEHAAWFFGRTRALDDVLAALKRQAAAERALVVVCGASGSGKSSLVRAGVVPLLTRPGVIEGIGLWRSAEVRPGQGADGPVAALAAALAAPGALPELLADGTTVASLARMLAETPEAVAALVKGGLSQAARETQLAEKLGSQPVARLALLVDQLEELVSAGERIGAAERERFARALGALAASGRVWVLATLRSDYFHRLGEVAREGAVYDLAPPTPAEIGQMVRQPAHAAGVTFEVDEASGAAVDDVLRDAAAGSPGALPLLSFVLDELYRRGAARGVLTHADLAELGGFAGAIARRAEAVYAACSPAARRCLAGLVARLATVDPEHAGAFVRRAASRDALSSSPAERELTDALIEGRLLQARDGAVEVAHEALFSHWPAVRALLEKDREWMAVRARLAVPCRQWVEEGRPPDRLVQDGKPLLEARELAARPADLTPELRAYVTASLAAATRRERMRRARLWLGIAALAGVTVGAVTACVAIARAWRATEVLRRDAGEQAARLAVERGLELARSGDPGRALLWFARGAGQAPAGSAIASVAAENLALWRPRTSALIRYARHPAAPADVAIAGTGEVVAIAREGGRIDVARMDRDPAPAAFSALIAAPETRGEVQSVDLSADGALGVSADATGAVTLWSAADGRAIGTARCGAAASVCAFAPDGAMVMVGCVDGQARAFSVSPAGLALAFTVSHGAPIAAVAWAERGTLLTAGGVECKLWKVADRQASWSFRTSGSVRAATILPGGETLATAGEDGLLTRWDRSGTGPREETPLKVADPGQGLVLSPDGALAAGGTRDAGTLVTELESGRALGQPLPHTAPARASSFSRSNRRLLAACSDHTVQLWQLAPPVAPEREWDLRDPVKGLDGGRRKLAAVELDSNFVDARTFDAELRRLPLSGGAPPADAGGTLLARGPGGAAQLFERPGGALELVDASGATPVPGTGRVLRAAIAPGGRAIFTDRAGPGAELWTRANGLTRTPVPGAGPVHAAVFSADAGWLAVGRDDGVALVALASGVRAGPLLPHRGGVLALAFSADSRRLASGGADGTVRAWNPVSGQPVGVPMTHHAAVRAVAFTPAGDRLLTGADDRTARVWDATSGAPATPPLAHAAAVLAVASARGGALILTAAADGMVQTWDVTSGLPVGPPFPHPGAATALAISRSDDRVATGCADGFARVWSAPWLAAAPAAPDLEAARTAIEVRVGLELDRSSTARVLSPEDWIRKVTK